MPCCIPPGHTEQALVDVVIYIVDDEEEEVAITKNSEHKSVSPPKLTSPSITNEALVHGTIFSYLDDNVTQLLLPYFLRVAVLGILDLVHTRFGFVTNHFSGEVA